MNFGLQRERPGDADALALAAGELVRVAVGEGAVQPDRVHQLHHPRPPLGLAELRVLVERLGDDRADGHARVEARLRVLEDHLHLRPQRPQRAALEPGDVAALELDRAGGRIVEPQDRAAGGGLAAAGLADEPERLALADLEADVVDRLDLADPAAQHAPGRSGSASSAPRPSRAAGRQAASRGPPVAGSPTSRRRRGRGRPASRGGFSTRQRLKTCAQRGANGQDGRRGASGSAAGPRWCAAAAPASPTTLGTVPSSARV